MELTLMEYEKIVLEQLKNKEDFYNFLEERNYRIIENNMGHEFSLQDKIEHVEASTLEYLEEISNIIKLSQEEQEERLERLNVDDKDILITSNLYIAARIGALLLKDGVDYMDLVQDGTIALIRSVEEFRKSNYLNFEEFSVLFVARSMILSIAKRLEETKSQFMRYFEHKIEEFGENDELVHELKKKLERLRNLNYFNLRCSLSDVEYRLVSEYYGLSGDRNISMYELEKKLELSSGSGEKTFQNAINKLSRFGGEMFEV